MKYNAPELFKFVGKIGWFAICLSCLVLLEAWEFFRPHLQDKRGIQP